PARDSASVRARAGRFARFAPLTGPLLQGECATDPAWPGQCAIHPAKTTGAGDVRLRSVACDQSSGDLHWPASGQAAGPVWRRPCWLDGREGQGREHDTHAASPDKPRSRVTRPASRPLKSLRDHARELSVPPREHSIAIDSTLRLPPVYRQRPLTTVSDGC